MADGSLSDAPVISPGPNDLHNFLSLFGIVYIIHNFMLANRILNVIIYIFTSNIRKEFGVERDTSNWEMLKELLKTVPADCRMALIWEFVFDPAALKRRYIHERIFKRNLERKWQGLKK